jgi:hypothetical protein
MGTVPIWKQWLIIAVRVLVSPLRAQDDFPREEAVVDYC